MERSEGVSILRIERAARRNALGDALVSQLRRALQDNDADADVGATVISAQAPGFCAGSDLKELGAMSLDEMIEHEARTAQFCREIAQLRKPVVAAVEGFALGGGFIFAASCDAVVTARSTRWNLPEVRIGWIPPWGIETLVNRVGLACARQLVWGARNLSGDDAVRLGVADHLADDGHALARATELAKELAQLPREAVASTKLYFATKAARDGEGGDRLASHLFRDDCRNPVAQATLKKFGVRV
ncbi:MAG: enoyl-CoA hydratase/isomerase family protein [Burkholderiaceae bacterium]|nr:enoyl-CoA hydratase/isomerase family protein [Burkholderiaceae bacterium]